VVAIGEHILIIISYENMLQQKARNKHRYAAHNQNEAFYAGITSSDANDGSGISDLQTEI